MDIEQIVREEVRAQIHQFFATHVAVLSGQQVTEAAKSVVKAQVKKATKRAPVVAGELRDADKAVLSHVKAGYQTAGTIGEALGVKSRTIGLTLTKLAKRGLIRKEGERRFTTYHMPKENGAAS